MHELKDKSDFISKYLDYLSLGDKDKLFEFNLKTSYFFIILWFIVLLFFTGFLIVSDRKILSIAHDLTKIFKYIEINYVHLKVFNLVMLIISSNRLNAAFNRRNRLLNNLQGFRILLDYMRVDEKDLFKNLQIIFPRVDTIELMNFSKSAFKRRSLKK
ncbi:hypothetical protein [Leptospira sp. GIMC2001]|uniref:hypothetical protein n=1 Tax=Leptospira sp. GIMC2001 TaxID=1513297 RepID=UPI00234A740B|nr:hypothetical protein [Leptospira sp. GIMC2001]WCL51031.1 hypothetical protein O4O04_09525 [Leptospira sp. GIMC2001]